MPYALLHFPDSLSLYDQNDLYDLYDFYDFYDFNDLNGFNDLNDLNDLPFTAHGLPPSA